MNKKLLKIGVGIGVPVAVVGLVTGLVLGLKKDEVKNLELPKASGSKETGSVNYFKKFEKNMQNSFMYQRGGHFLSDKLILLQPDSGDQGNLVDKKDKDSKWTKTINFKELSTKKYANKALLDVNNELFNFINKKENKTKRWGITWQSNKNHNSMILNVYHLKEEDQNDKKIIDQFIAEFTKAQKKDKGDIKAWADNLKETNATLDFPKLLSAKLKETNATFDFPKLLSAKYMPADYKYQWHFPFNWNSKNILSTQSLKSVDKNGSALNPPKEITNISTDKDVPTQKVDKKDATGGSVSLLQWGDKTDVKMENNLIWREFNVELLKHKIIPTVESIVDFTKDSSGKTKTKLLLLFSFYKLDKNSIIKFKGHGDTVQSPENTYLRTISFDMQNIIDGLSSEKRADKIESNEVNLKKVYKTFSEDWMKLLKSSPIINSYLDLVNKFIPSIGNSFKDFHDTLNFLNKLKAKNTKISSKDALDYIFNDKKSGKKSLSEKILEKVNNSDFLMPKDVFNVWFEDFKVKKPGVLQKFMSTSNFFDSTKKETMSSQRLLYYIYAGSRAFDPLIRDRLNELLKDGTLKTNYYDEETQSVITKFIKQLKDQKILDNSFSIIDLTNEEKRNTALVKIINAIKNKKQISVPKEIFSLLNLNNSVDTILTSIINSDYINDLLTLVIGKDDVNTALTEILKDPVNKLISRIMKNIDTDLGKKALENLSKKVDLKEIIKPLIPQEYMGLIDGLINGFKTRKELIDFFDKMLDDGMIKGFLIGGKNDSDPNIGTIKHLYEGVFVQDDAIFVLGKISEDDIKHFSIILKKGIKNSTEKEISNFLDSVNNIIVNKLPILFTSLKQIVASISKPAILDDISKYLKILLPTVKKQPSASPTPEAQKLAKLLKALASK